jgi:hypothetical protein
MATTPLTPALANLTTIANSLSTLATSLGGAGSAAGNSADLFPIKCLGSPNRPNFLGIPTLETYYHNSMEQGRFNEKSIGDALHWVRKEQYELNQKIQNYLDLNRLQTSCQLTHAPRVIKLVADGVHFLKVIQGYVQQTQMCIIALQANLNMLLAMEKQMLSMIQQLLSDLANLLAAICNWHLPALPSLAATLGQIWHWSGFNFNSLAGFNLTAGLNLNFNFSFSQCQLSTAGNTSSFFSTPPNSVTSPPLTFTAGAYTVPMNGSVGDPSQYSDPDYIAQMVATTTPVVDPNTFTLSSPASLPSPSSIISNFSLTPSQYAANVVSIVPATQPAVLPANQTTPATPAQQLVLQNLLINSVSLAAIVASEYDPNITAAWLLYVGLNRAGRAGNWIAEFEAEYTALIVPSLTYLQTTNVPYNNLLGGTGVTDAPPAIPLIAALKADTTQNLLWRLTYIEAALLGYARNVTWDGAADSVYTASYTGTDTDFRFTTVDLTNTATVTLGATTAAYPVPCTYPQAIASVLNQVIAQATIDIAQDVTFQSSRPQFRYTYNIFAQATLVDRFSQFWREFNQNLITFLTQPAYQVGFVVSYATTLNAAINPLADPTPYTALVQDAETRNPNWVPGGDLLNIPTALLVSQAGEPPTDATNGWSNNALDAAAFLARPDIQAQSIPVQMAMLRTNQSYAALMVLQSNVQQTVQTAVAAVQASIASAQNSGWEVETSAAQAIPAGATGTAVSFGQIDQDQTSFVASPTTIVAQITGAFILAGEIDWDSTGTNGSRTVNVLQNGTVISSTVNDPSGPNAFTQQFSTLVELNEGDTLQVQVLHGLGTPQNVLSGSNFFGLLDPNSTTQDTQALASVPTASNGSPAQSFIADANLPALTAVSIVADGGLLAVDPTVTTAGVTPFVDGITLAAAVEGQSATIGTTYGALYQVSGASFVVGNLIYVTTGGALTQNYATIAASLPWIVCVGRAVTADSFLFEPHIPQNNTP